MTLPVFALMTLKTMSLYADQLTSTTKLATNLTSENEQQTFTSVRRLHHWVLSKALI